MKTIRSWNDLSGYGIHALTGESCGLGCRILCDLTEQGKAIVEKCFDVRLELASPWNQSGIGSIMLPYELLMPLGVFALLETGCVEVWRKDELIGFEANDDRSYVAQGIDRSWRRYAYGGSAGSRNVHAMTGRVR